MIQPSRISCSGVWLWRALLSALLLSGQAAAQSAAENSLAHALPPDVGLFVEAERADDLLIALTDPQIWTALAELAGQPADVHEADQWRARIRETVKMEPAHAIRVLFSQRVAFAGEGPGRAQDAIVLCRPMDPIQIPDLLRIWQAQPLQPEATPAAYRLHGNIGLARQDRLLIFGDVLLPDGLFQRVRKFLASERPLSLAEDPTFRALLARVPANPDGVLFARLPRRHIHPPLTTIGSQPASAPVPTPQLPGPLRGASNILLALHRSGTLLHISAVGDAPVVPHRMLPAPRLLLARLPARTLFAWGIGVDYAALVAGIDRLPERNALRIAAALTEQSDLVGRLADALGDETAVAVGVITPRTRDDVPLPAVAALISTRDAGVVADTFRNVAGSVLAAYNVMALTRGQEALPPTRQVDVEGVAVFVQDLSPLLKDTARQILGQVHLAWAVDDKLLIIASHEDWLRQIIAARHGRAEPLAPVFEMTPRRDSGESEALMVLQTGPLSDVGQLWLDHLQRVAPQTLEENWWLTRQPPRGVHLGIEVSEEPDRQRLRVISVEEGMPAAGVLRVGDEIVGCGDRKFATEQPIREMRVALAVRAHGRWVDLHVVRDGMPLQLRVPVPFVDLSQLLRQAIAVGRLSQRVLYQEDAADPAGPRGLLTVELRTSPIPLFNLGPSATSAPANPVGNGTN